MKAVTCRQYGSPDALESIDLPTPVPKHDEVLIQVLATTVTSADHRIRALDMPRGFGPIARLIFGFAQPRQPILGSELSGFVAAVGKDVTRFKVGEEVFAYTSASMGCHAEYIAIRQDTAIAAKPASLSFEEAAALSFGGTTALAFLRKAKIKPGDAVLINGASGSVGSAAVQLARHFGAHVTGVSSGPNAELVRSIGAHAVIDYTTADFTKSGERYDIVLDATGTLSFSGCREALKPGGRLVLAVADLPGMLTAPFAPLAGGGRKVIAGPTNGTADDLRFLAALAEAGEYRPVIDSVFSFDAIAEAHRRVDTGRKRGNVVVRVASN